jgi:hypothetical protein
MIKRINKVKCICNPPRNRTDLNTSPNLESSGDTPSAGHLLSIGVLPLVLVRPGCMYYKQNTSGYPYHIAASIAASLIFDFSSYCYQVTKVHILISPIPWKACKFNFKIIITACFQNKQNFKMTQYY